MISGLKESRLCSTSGSLAGAMSANEFDSYIRRMVAKARALGHPVGETVLLSPEMARVLLERNVDNRSFNQNQFRFLVRMIQNGSWVENGMPMIVTDRGRTADAQHRCAAIAYCGQTLPVFLIVGVSDDPRVLSTIGTGMVVRSATQVAKMLIDKSANSIFIGGMKVAIWGMPMQEFKLGNDELVGLLEVFGDMGTLAIDLCSTRAKDSRRVNSAVMFGVLIRAAYHEDWDMLRRFVAVAFGAVAEGAKESAAVKYRNFALNDKPSGSCQARRISYSRLQNAIQHFCAGNEVSILRNADSEVYHFPQDVQERLPKPLTDVACPKVETLRGDKSLLFN